MLGIISAIGGFLSSVITTIGPAIASAASALVAKLPIVVVGMKMVLEVISGVVVKIAEVLGIVPKGENPEELGAKAMQEDTKPRTEFETTQEYLDYLRQEVPLDKEKYVTMSTEEKVACNALGITMITQSIEEKTGVELSPEFLMTIYRAKLRYEQVEKFINAFAGNGMTSMDELTEYITNGLSEERADKVGGILKESIRELSPSMSDEEIMQEVVGMKRAYNEAEY